MSDAAERNEVHPMTDAPQRAAKDPTCSHDSSLTNSTSEDVKNLLALNSNHSMSAAAAAAEDSPRGSRKHVTVMAHHHTASSDLSSSSTDFGTIRKSFRRSEMTTPSAEGGSEGGYAGSASCSSCTQHSSQRLLSSSRKRPRTETTSSSDIADFSSSYSITSEDEDEEETMEWLTTKPKSNQETSSSSSSPLLTLGCEVMAHVLTFLEPLETLKVLTMPLSRDYVNRFSRQAELWRVLCLLEPFRATIQDENDSEDSSLESSMGASADPTKYRLLYTTFCRCLRYLRRIQDDAANGRPPTIMDRYSENQSLQEFLARARTAVVQRSRNDPILASSIPKQQGNDATNNEEREAPIGVADDGSDTSSAGAELKKKKKKPKVVYGNSIITQRLLGPTAEGIAGQRELPWSCAIFSIVNWMVAFYDVQGIQTMCLKVLPQLLEDESQRVVAQRANLDKVVLRAMTLFPNCGVLHTAAFHTIVLLARPLGGREGMLFHTHMLSSSAGIFGEAGISCLLDSMRRFQENEVLQAMSCWSLVNIALQPAQKLVLVRLGGVQVTLAAMRHHAQSAEVQFRALFCLINLVIPMESEHARGVLDNLVSEIVRLVVLAMRSFGQSQAVVNRACLVLHNLSLTNDYHSTLLLDDDCLPLLEWCLTTFGHDDVLKKSATGTIQRLQATLSSNPNLRNLRKRQTPQQASLEQTHSEAVAQHEQSRRQRRENN